MVPLGGRGEGELGRARAWGVHAPAVPTEGSVGREALLMQGVR